MATLYVLDDDISGSVGADVERHSPAADRMPRGDPALQRACVIAAPPQFGDRVAADLEAIDAIDRNWPATWQGLRPLFDRLGITQGRAVQHITATCQIIAHADVQQHG